MTSWKFHIEGTWASIADKSALTKPAECERCAGAAYKKIDVTKYYRNTEGARWGRDFRSGNPGEKTKWLVGPISISAVQKIKFEYEYVTGYSGNCGWAKYTGFRACENNQNWQTKSPIMNVYLQNAENEDQMQMIYTSGMLKHYPYDNCGANGGWGESETKNDGCYSPPVKVEAQKQSDGSWAMTENTELTKAIGDLEKGEPGATEKTSKKGNYDAEAWVNDATNFKVVFEFDNRARNMHLNPHHMDMQILGASFDPESKACL